jgi:cytochrome c553
MPRHIARLIMLIVGLGAVALVAKSLLTADTFHEFGHYRGDSVIQVAALEPVFQTPRYCESCHAERLAQWSAHSHKSVTCEVCHGPARGHPANGKLPIPKDTIRLCGTCHEVTAGRPRSQPQVDLIPHTVGEPCITCHNPHAPKIAAAAAFVAADSAAGSKRAASCAGCHGAQGISGNDLWPSLAGQHAAYLERILGAYKSGGQRDVMMTPIVKDLSDAEVRDLAMHYARLACGTPAKAKVGDAAAGKSLARNCAACHGETGIAPNPAWPSLAAQKPGYIVNALKAFRAGLRTDPMMAGVARGLSDTDMVNLAAFYSEQSCAPIKQARSTP